MPLRLVSAQSPAFERIMFHEATREGGVARMRHVSEITIAPHATLTFEPGGLHLMMESPVRPLRVGEEVVVELSFAGGAKIAATFTVVAP